MAVGCGRLFVKIVVIIFFSRFLFICSVIFNFFYLEIKFFGLVFDFGRFRDVDDRIRINDIVLVLSLDLDVFVRC